MGSVMSYALGLGPDRPAPAGILAFSGFVPTVDGWQPSASPDRTARARSSPTAATTRSWTCLRAPRAGLLEAGGIRRVPRVRRRAHIDPAHVPAAVDWLRATFNFFGLDGIISLRSWPKR